VKICLACDFRFEGADWRCPACGWSPGGNEYLSFAPELSGNDVFDPNYYADLARLEAGHFWFRARNALIIWTLQSQFQTARTLLEIGCGTGIVLASVRSKLPHLRLSGSDIHSEGLEYAHSRVPDVTLLQMDARRIPFEDEFDVVAAFDVLEHIDEDELVLDQMRRATRRGGGILITVPQHRWLWSGADEAGHHKRRYTRAEAEAKVRRAGLDPVRVTSFVSLVLPLMVFSRLRQRYGRHYDPHDELQLPSWLNARLRQLLAIEGALIRRGASLPFGGSLLVVARRS
jgi:ubiquinone/menaquinone biosynthesis C-methylase UbiE